MISLSLAVFSSSESSMVSSLPVLLSNFSSSLMFMHILVGSVHVYSSKTVFGHWKSIMATREGSMARSVMASGLMLKVASSMRMDMAVTMSLRDFASAILILNKEYTSPLTAYV